MQRLLSYFFLALLFQNILLAQDEESKAIDSLMKLDFKELEKEFYETIKKDSLNAELLAKKYFHKADMVDSVYEKANGYFFMSLLSSKDYERRILYIDSAINIISKSKHIMYKAYLYTHKGAITEENGNNEKALDYWLEGLAHSEKNNILFFISILQSNIAILKRKLGNYNEAKTLFRKALAYQKVRKGKKLEDSIPYLITLSELFTTCVKNKEIDSAIYYHNQGFKMSKGTDIEGLYVLNKGILQYYDKKYEKGLVTINKGLDGFLKSKYKIEYGKHNIIDGYLYLGKSYQILSKRENASNYFKKIDSLIKKSNHLISESTRMAYLEIIDYYKLLDDKDTQLYYINRLLHYDSISKDKNKILNSKLNKEFDIPLLISQKESIINGLKTKNNQSYYIIYVSLIIIVIISTVLYIIFRKNKLYKKRFDDLMSSNIKEIKRVDASISENNLSLDIAKDVVESILGQLKDFEKNEGFLEINLTSSILAKKMNTNSKYLTKVIKFYRGKSFSPYINDLRIDHIVEELKANKKIRNYTIKALAIEAGFNSAEVFSKSFYKKTGIYPSYFIKELTT